MPVVSPSSLRAVPGFSLVELVMSIAVVGVLAVVAGRFIAQPVEGYVDTTRRAELVELGAGALHRITREIRLAVPNSVRVSGDGRAVEFLRIRTGGRYRAEGPGDPLDFAAGTDSFDVIGGLPDASSVLASPGATLGDCVGGTVDCLVVYNTGQPGADAFALDNVAAVQAATASTVSFSRPAPFPLRSPRGRFYVVETPVSFVCDPGAGTLSRHARYPLTAVHGAVDSDAELIGAGSSSQRLADGIDACRFAYQAGTATRGALISLELSVEHDAERVSLLQQIHVGNVP
jgi:MSHA biogenesis protein MshO